MSSTSTNNDIYLIKNFISLEICSEILENARLTNSIKPDATNGGSPFEIISDFSSSRTVGLVLDKINSTIRQLYPGYSISKQVEHRNSLIKIQKPGDEHTEHSDSNKNSSEKYFGRSMMDEKAGLFPLISTIIVLNNNYNGGEFYFSEYQMFFRITAGTLLIWPSEGNHHGVNTVKGDNPRYSLVSLWYESNNQQTSEIRE